MVAVTRNIGVAVTGRTKGGKTPPVVGRPGRPDIKKAVIKAFEDDGLELDDAQAVAKPAKNSTKTTQQTGASNMKTTQPQATNKATKIVKAMASWFAQSKEDLLAIAAEWESEDGEGDKTKYRELFKTEFVPGMVWKKLTSSPVFGFEFTYGGERYRVAFKGDSAALRIAESDVVETVKPDKKPKVDVITESDVKENYIIAMLGGSIKPLRIAIKGIPVKYKMYPNGSVAFEDEHLASIKRRLKAENVLKEVTIAPHSKLEGWTIISTKAGEDEAETVKPATVKDKVKKALRIPLNEDTFNAALARIALLETVLAQRSTSTGTKSPKEPKPATTTSTAGTKPPKPIPAHTPVINDKKWKSPDARAEALLETLGTKLKGAGKYRIPDGTIIKAEVTVVPGNPGSVEILIPHEVRRLVRKARATLGFAVKEGKRGEFTYLLA
jgi:hypothetical protein